MPSTIRKLQGFWRVPLNFTCFILQPGSSVDPAKECKASGAPEDRLFFSVAGPEAPLQGIPQSSPGAQGKWDKG